MDVDARIYALQKVIEGLEEKIAYLEDLLGMSLDAPIELGLTPSEARVLGLLLKRDVATKDGLMVALYGRGNREEAEIKIVDVFICKIRKKLKPFSLTIETVWGQGYTMPKESKALFNKLFQEENPDRPINIL